MVQFWLHKMYYQHNDGIKIIELNLSNKVYGFIIQKNVWNHSRPLMTKSNKLREKKHLYNICYKAQLVVVWRPHFTFMVAFRPFIKLLSDWYKQIWSDVCYNFVLHTVSKQYQIWLRRSIKMALIPLQCTCCIYCRKQEQITASLSSAPPPGRHAGKVNYLIISPPSEQKAISPHQH